MLIAIADGRLPDERPNYEYFARLLNADADVFLRPKQCRIFVSSSGVILKDDIVTAEDGTTRKQTVGHTLEGHRLSDKDYPHLKLNEGKDYKDLPITNGRSPVLLHEYTKTLSQKESSSIRDISNRWEVRFPELRDKLLVAMDDTHHTDELSSRCVVGPCDTFQFEVVLDLHANSKFPGGSELNGMVELSIAHRDLQGHRWRSMTSVVKPSELHINNSEPEFWDRTNPVDVIVSHRAGCSMRPHCDCAMRGSRDTICVPFPAASWANTFIKLAPYVNAERERKEREAGSSLPHTRPNGRSEAEDGTSKSNAKRNPPSPKELLDQVAMYQEIWSAPSDDGGHMRGMGDKKSEGWRRRAVILWTFAPVHDQADDKGKAVTVPAGTSWKFLTKFDPTSQYHQQHAYLSGSPNVSRDAVLSPSPGCSHHLATNMQDNLSAVYDNGHHVSMPQSHLGVMTPNQMNLSLLDGYPNGLATPPPTAGLPHAYSHGYDTSAGHLGGSDAALQHHLSFMSDGVSGGGGGSGIAAHTPMTATDTDPFLLGVSVGSSGNESFDDSGLGSGADENGLHSWASQGLDTSQWGHAGLLDSVQQHTGSHNASSWAHSPVNSLPTTSTFDHGLGLSTGLKDSAIISSRSSNVRSLHHANMFAIASNNNNNRGLLHHQMPIAASSLHQRRQYQHQQQQQAQQQQQQQGEDPWASQSWATTSPLLAHPSGHSTPTPTPGGAPAPALSNGGSGSNNTHHEDFALSLASLRSGASSAAPGAPHTHTHTHNTRKRGRDEDGSADLDGASPDFGAVPGGAAADEEQQHRSIMRKLAHPQAALQNMRQQRQQASGAPTPDMAGGEDDEGFSFDA